MTIRQSNVASINTVISPPVGDLADGFTVRRAPSGHRRMVGPFILFNHMGPAVFDAGHGFDMAPHPHIGLATVTYLTDGKILHRDNLGGMQTIRPGEVN
jgi:redox-sensitive bicupin YhaK (pirin superfamily)